MDKIIAKKIKSVHDFNWSWQMWNNIEQKWIQFDCPECLNLEFNYQAYNICGHSIYKTVQIIPGTVDLQKLVITQRSFL